LAPRSHGVPPIESRFASECTQPLF
jgi:hypothetical protein